MGVGRKKGVGRGGRLDSDFLLHSSKTSLQCLKLF